MNTILIIVIITYAGVMAIRYHQRHHKRISFQIISNYIVKIDGVLNTYKGKFLGIQKRLWVLNKTRKVFQHLENSRKQNNWRRIIIAFHENMRLYIT